MNFSAGELWWVDLPGGAGREQRGRRPALVLGKANGMGIVMPLTTNPSAANLKFTYSIMPSKENGLREESIVLVFQIAAIDESCFIEKLGWLAEEERLPAKELLKEMLKLE